jgi:hypothetical protein
MKCYSFAKTERPGVNHFELPSDPIVVNATLAILNAPTPRGLCSSAATLVSPAAFLLNLLTTVWQGSALGDQLFLSKTGLRREQTQYGYFYLLFLCHVARNLKEGW